MNKISLIIRREFITRIRKKSFIIMTIVGPLLFAGIMILPIWLALRDSTDQRVIEVIDESGLFKGSIEDQGNIKFRFANTDLEEAKAQILENDAYGLLYIPDINIFDPDGIRFFSQSNPSLEVKETLQRTINTHIEDLKIGESGIQRETIESIRTSVNINTINISERGEKETNAEIATAVGYVFSFLIYFFIFLYGAQVMRGVIEEKSNRIVEIIISAVRPFQLMTGKIIGVASVGLTQFILWVILTFGIYSIASNFFDFDMGQRQQMVPQMEQTAEIPQPSNSEDVSKIIDAFNSIPVFTILVSFVIYFLGGYFLYGALFAAVGSAADSETDTQQFMLPITIPLIFSILVLSAVLKEPDSSLAFWLSIIPFTSPVVMMMRIPFDVPIWQLILSIVLLILGFMFTAWLASRIYRIGILVHGSKVNYKILGKWLFMKQ